MGGGSKLLCSASLLLLGWGSGTGTLGFVSPPTGGGVFSLGCRNRRSETSTRSAGCFVGGSGSLSSRRAASLSRFRTWAASEENFDGDSGEVERVSLWSTEDIYRDLNLALSRREAQSRLVGSDFASSIAEEEVEEEEEEEEDVYCGKKMKEMYYRYAFLSNTRGKSADMLPVSPPPPLQEVTEEYEDSSRVSSPENDDSLSPMILAFAGEAAPATPASVRRFLKQAELKHSRMALVFLVAYLVIVSQQPGADLDTFLELEAFSGHDGGGLGMQVGTNVGLALAFAELLSIVGIGKELESRLERETTMNLSESVRNILRQSEAWHGRIALVIMSLACGMSML